MDAVMKMMKNLSSQMRKNPLVAAAVIICTAVVLSVVLSMTVLKNLAPVRMLRRQVRKLSDTVSRLLPGNDDA